MRAVLLLVLPILIGCSENPVASSKPPAAGASAPAPAKGSSVAMSAPQPVDKARVEAHIRELVARQAAAERARAELAPQFPIEGARFFYDDATPSIELQVTNKTDKTISRAYFDASASSPGRPVPWVKTTINYPLPAGLEPGKSATWSFPVFADDWKQVPRDGEDVRLELAVYRLDDETGASLIAVDDFTELDHETLVDLLKATEQTGTEP